MRKTLGLLAVLLALVPVASAHADLESSDPPRNGHADYGLTRIVMNFTEDVEHEYTDADVIDLNGTSHKVGAISFNASKHNQVILTTTPLPDGLYTVNWRTLSVDSHILPGTFIFGVGSIVVQVPLDASAEHNHNPGDTAKDGFGRGVYYAGLALALGIPFFLLVVDRAAGLPRSALTTAAIFGFLGAAGGFLGALLLADRTGLTLAAALTTLPGRSFLWRALLLALAAAAATVGALAPSLLARRALAAVAIAAGTASLLATAYASHAAADLAQRNLSLAADTLHLAMGAIWVGGVVAFLHTARGRTAHETAQLVVRFTPWGIASVVLLLATGTYASFRHLPRVSDLWLDAYGRLILVKIALLGVLVLIGAYNKEILGPRLAAAKASARYFRRVLQVEALTMVCVLAAAGVLASTPPPDQASELASGPLPYQEFSAVTSTMHVVLQIHPNPVVVGVQRITISLHPLGAALPNGTEITLKVAPASEREPEGHATLTKINDGSFTGEDGYFTSVGKWRVYVLLQTRDEFQKVTFDVDVLAPT